MLRRFRVIVPETGFHGRPQPVWRVGSVLKHRLGLSRVERVRIWRLGGLTVNGRPVEVQHAHCFPGDVIDAWYPEATSGVQPEPDGPLRVLYEDAWLLAVDKPAGQLSHPARSEQRGTVANAVAARYRLAGTEAPEPVRPVHRLDRDTSGVLLFARDASTARILARQRAKGDLTRDYLALVAGHPPAEGEIDFPLSPDPTHRARRMAYRPGEASDSGAVAALDDTEHETASPDAPGAAQPAHTSYRVVQHGQGMTLIAARLRTGRTHQVRAHLAAIGHPLLADDLYGGPPWPEIRRHALHAWRARLRHPATGAWLTITAPFPEDMRRAVRT
ncbi:MAG: RluA family pseudouridine synthase [Chloroflexota bacterium]